MGQLSGRPLKTVSIFVACIKCHEVEKTQLNNQCNLSLVLTFRTVNNFSLVATKTLKVCLLSWYSDLSNDFAVIVFTVGGTVIFSLFVFFSALSTH